MKRLWSRTLAGSIPKPKVSFGFMTSVYHVLFNLQRENHKYDQTDKSFVLLHKHTYPETKEVWLFQDSFPSLSLCPLKGREDLTSPHRLLWAKQETRWTSFSLMLPSSKGKKIKATFRHDFTKKKKKCERKSKRRH